MNGEYIEKENVNIIVLLQEDFVLKEEEIAVFNSWCDNHFTYENGECGG